MKYYEYTFHCGKLPSRLTIHAILTHFFGKDELEHINFKSFKEGRLIKIVSDKFIDKKFEIELFNKKSEKFIVTLIKTEELDSVKYNEGQKVTLSGIIEYGMNITGKKGKKCPVFMGRFESKDMQEKFKETIENNFGVKIIEMNNVFFTRNISEQLTSRIQINNIIEINLPVIVVNPELLEQSNYKSYFQKRSFGFGNIEII